LDDGIPVRIHDREIEFIDPHQFKGFDWRVFVAQQDIRCCAANEGAVFLLLLAIHETPVCHQMFLGI
jgi:hypothetical protein